MIIRCLCFLLLTIGLSANAFAKDAPEITLRGDDELGAFISDGLILENLGIDVDVQSGLAQVSLTATLRNETDDDVETSFAYPLPDGAVINGYGLDIEGELVDGVLMPKERAEALYTDRVTATVDPGIAARTADNRYRTRIYPIFAEGGKRSVRLDFTVPIPASGLRLPLSQDKPIERVSIKISGEGASEARSPIKGDTVENKALSGDIFIPAAPAGASLSRSAGQTFLTLPLAAPVSRTHTGARSVTVIWDTSLSRESQPLSEERRFVTSVLATLRSEKQSLIHGADRIDSAAAYGTRTALSAALTGLTYDGATDLSALLDPASLSHKDMNPDICLLISDGRSSLGTSGLPNLPCRVFTYSADKNPNTDYLSLVASRNNGADLSSLGPSDAARLIAADSGYQLAPGQKGDIFIAGNRHWLIVPVDENARRLTIQFQDREQDIDLRKLSATKHRSASSLWGQRRMAALRAKGPSAFDAIVKTSRRYGVQGKETAFLVLESANDYIEAKIDPPKNFPSEEMETYKEDLAEAKLEAAEDLADHLEDVLDEWKNQVEWWETDWAELAKEEEDRGKANPEPLVIMPSPPSPPSPQTTCWDGTSVSDMSMCPSQPAPPIRETLQDLRASESEDNIVVTGSRYRGEDGGDEVIVMGARRGNPAGEIEISREITVSVRDWSPDRPFLTALADLQDNAFESEYLRQRKEHGDLPSFYLEIADQLHRNGRTDRAAKMATTALDLPSTTMITRANVADRLLMYGRSATAISLYREILPTTQDRPQPFYNLALALIQAGDASKGETRERHYREAFEHLIHVISQPWEDDYAGIHLIALQDLNRTLARLPKKTRKKIQKELGLNKAFYRNLDVDIRVLVDWTSDDADIDIHVIERVNAEDEEEAYFRNTQTVMGGRVSNDMMDGYGPEEYLIRRAPDGLYRVATDYYAQDAYAEDGALKLRARIWRNYGRRSETQNTVIIEMLEEKEDDYILGEIKIGPKTEGFQD